MISNSLLVSSGVDQNAEGRVAHRGVFPCPLAFVPPGGRGRPRNLQAQFQINVTRRADTAATVRVVQVEEVTMRFVIHFVSVYCIIHPGGQRASNMPGTACDRVQQL